MYDVEVGSGRAAAGSRGRTAERGQAWLGLIRIEPEPLTEGLLCSTLAAAEETVLFIPPFAFWPLSSNLVMPGALLLQ